MVVADDADVVRDLCKQANFRRGPAVGRTGENIADLADLALDRQSADFLAVSFAGLISDILVN